MVYEDLEIVYWPDPRLLRGSVPVERIDADFHALIARMFELMYASKGVGLAAPQVGINQRFFVLNVTGEPEDERVYINPEIVAREGEAFEEEGCLSFPDISVRVHRAARATIRATNMKGQRVEATGEGLIARAWQHETDHLDGITLAQKMTKLDQFSKRRQLKHLQKRYAAAASGAHSD